MRIFPFTQHTVSHFKKVKFKHCTTRFYRVDEGNLMANCNCSPRIKCGTSVIRHVQDSRNIQAIHAGL